MATPQAARLAAYVSLPEEHFVSLTTSPTVELVSELLAKLEQKAAEHERASAEKLRLEVELESAVRSSESKAKSMRGSIENAQRQVAEVRQQLEAEQSAKFILQTELSELKSSSSSSASDLATLQQRVSSLESANRDTLSLLESKSKAHDGLAQELSAKHQKTVELRREVSELEDKIRAGNATMTSAKFREQALEQEVESLKRSNDYFEQELKTKTSEHSKFRKEKAARIAELQQQQEDNTVMIERLQRIEKALRNRTAELEVKAEEYIIQVQQIRDELTRQEESFRAELDTANRLHELMKEKADTEKDRAEFLQTQYDTVQDEARDEFAKIEEELKTAQNDKDTAEKRVSELEVLVERLESDLAAAPAVAPPATPRFNGSIRPGSAPRTPQRGMSPAPLGSAVKGNMSYTQLVSDYHEVRRQRDAERRRKEELSAQIDQMMQDLEQSQPGIEQLKADHDRQQADIAEMSALVESAGKERDLAKKDARNMESQVAGLSREGEILRQQLRDLSSQIKILLLEVNARDQGKGSFTPEERLRLEQIATSEDGAVQYSHDTDRFISENLVSFRSIVELQEQNMKMLRISRELGDKMEGEEARMRNSQAQQDHEEVQELRKKYERCREEIKSLITQSQSYIRERDIFRRMLAHRGQMPLQSDIASMFGESVNGDALRTPARNGVHQSVEMSPSSREAADFNKLIKEMQTHFDSYKTEAFEERKQLKDQVQGLTAKAGDLRNELARRSGELTLATERYEMLHGNYNMLKNENAELQKRTQVASDRAAQQDLRVQTVAEDLVEAKSLAEGMRKETANLKAEKDFWKTVEKRLNEDNQSLVTERDRLNTLNVNLQNLLNDREHSDSESRRRLESQIESLESEIQSTRRRLAEAEEEVKRNSMRREFDNQEAQTRIDDLVKSLSAIREEFAAAKATRDQLQLRVDELTIELRSAEERLQVLSAPTVGAADANGDNTMNLSQDQDFALQMSELKRDLELARRDVISAQEQVEQYKSISLGSEEQLESLNTSHDEYKQEMDGLLEQKESKIKELGEAVERMRVAATESATELETLRIQKDDHDHVLQEQKLQFESETARLKDAVERAETAARFHQEDLKAQAEIARQAQENYDNELQKHAEASKNVQIVRAEANQVRLELVEMRTTLEAAENDLAQGEEKWTESKARFEQEIAEIRLRRDDVSNQNKLLHEQLEKVNNQIVELQRSRAGAASSEEASLASSQSNDVAGLQELIKWLRREKEIVDIQYQQQALEAKRQRQQIEHLQTQLDDTRLKLSQQMRAEEDRERSVLNHNKLMDTINELNLIRESNATLRLEKTQAQSSLADRIQEIDALQAELQPLHAKVQELEDLRESQQEDLRMAREARERFEQRYHDVLNRTDSIDPAEFESLKEQVVAVSTERDEVKTQAATLQEQVDGFSAQIAKSVEEANEAAEERRKKIIDQARNKNREQTAKIKEKETALEQMTEAQQGLQTQLQRLTTELEEVESAKADFESRLQQAEAAAAAAGRAQTVSNVDSAELASVRDQLAQATARGDGNAAETNEVRKQLDTAQTRIQGLEEEISSTKASLEQARSEIVQLQTQESNNMSDAASTDELRQELLQAIQDVIALREDTVAPEAGESSESSDSMADKAGEILAELVTRHEKRIADTEEKVASRVNALQAELDTKLSSAQASAREEIQREHDVIIQQLKGQHRQEMEDLASRHKLEVEELERRVASASAAQGSAPAVFSVESVTNDQAKELLKSHEFTRSLVLKNITTRVNQAKEQAAKELAEKLAEAESKAKNAQDEAVKVARDQAQQMEAKKQTVKLNMAQNQARMANVKIDYVKTAASETPEKQVREVWEVAKDLKPPPPAAAAAAAAAAVATPVKTAGLGSSVHAQSPLAAKPSPAGAHFQSAQTNPSTPVAAVPLQASAPQVPANAFAPQPAAQIPSFAQSQPAGSPFATASGVANAQRAESPFLQKDAPVEAEAKTDDPMKTEQASAQPAAAAIARPPSQQASRLPDASAGQGAGRGNGRGHIGSGLPVAGGRGQQQQQQQQRGGPAQRGRGRGGPGRGSGIPQPGGPQQSQQQPQQGNMNAGAKQFVPQKRGLDASEHAGGAEKRQRGGKA